MQKEIFYANLLVQDGKNTKWIKEVIYKETDGYFHNKRYVKEPLKVIKVDVIKSLGFDCENLSHTEVKKSDEKRNTITGAYE